MAAAPAIRMNERRETLDPKGIEISSMKSLD
jgi:hypothetical protein